MTGPRIILIDDEEHNHLITDHVLKQSFRNYTLVCFLNRDEAWEELQREAPDLLITDMHSDNVPGRTEYFGISGAELLRRLAERQVDYPVLVVSGCFSLSRWEAYAKAQAGPHLRARFLTKPCSMELFQTALRECLGADRWCWIEQR